MLESSVLEPDIVQLQMLAYLSPAGCFVEVGVWRGGTAQRLETIARMQCRLFYAYDTFTGMPYKDKNDYHEIGHFENTSYEEVRKALPDTHVIKGIFPESAVPMPPVAFAHIDCDQYQSIKESALYLQPLMVKGGIILFDDANVEHLPMATQAVEELFEGRIIKIPDRKWFVIF